MPQSIPAGFHTVTPSLTVREAARAIEFYKKAFGAEEVSRFDGPNGKVMHADLKIGDSHIFLNDEIPAMGVRSPQGGGGNSVSLFLYVNNVDQVFQQAVSAGAKSSMPLSNMFWGDRYGKVTDPFGHEWGLATHVEDVSPAEMEQRQQKWLSSMAS